MEKYLPATRIEDKVSYYGEVRKINENWAIGAAIYEPLEKAFAAYEGYNVELEIKLTRKV